MKNKILDIRYILFFLVLLLLITPFLQNNLNIFEIEPLKGDIDEVQEVNFSFNEWFDANYQNQQETYLNESFGFRNSLVRLHNQLRFSLFKNANARGIVVGIDNYLYELPYINAYYGIDFIGEDSIKKRMQQLKYVQDTLEKLDKNIILIFAAGKASFYPEYIPEKYRVEKKINNYEVYTKYAHELGIAHIDFNKWFIENKNISPYPLFPQYGIHWSNYSMFYVADSIISYIEDLRNINMRHLYWDEIKFDQAKKGDYDIAEGMNLLYYLPSYEMAYPKVFVEIDTGQVKPRIVSVADSFYWGIYN
ncbi:MAG: hypothetical protein GX879_09625, partial [Bacteroidales bacterium]|nr:hypothetical protein [Bacteroidales bacterium]